MKTILLEILEELSPCSVTEIIDYINSDLFYIKGNECKEDISKRKIRYWLDKIIAENVQIVKFQCENGYKIRYGVTKFKYYLLSEPRYMRVNGYVKPCMFCGMPIYIEDKRIFHFKYHCQQYQPQNYFILMKVENFWALISKIYIHGIIDDLNKAKLRLPARNEQDSSLILSEFWLINQKAREKKYIELDQILSVKANEFIA